MVSLSAILHSKANKIGKFPIAIRITKDRRSSKVFIGEAIDKKEWDEKTKKVKRNHPNSQRLNDMLIKKKAEINELRLKYELQEKEFTASSLAEEIRDKMSPLRVKKKKDSLDISEDRKNNRNYMTTITHEHNSYFELAGNYLDNLEQEGHYDQLSTNRSRVKIFWTFLNKKDIAFEDITVQLLHNYKSFLKGANGNSERTAINHLIVIRTIFNRAINSNMVDPSLYPFGKNKVAIKFPDSIKIGLTEAEISRIIKVDLSDRPSLENARNIWLTSFYFAGMRISDVLKLRWSNIRDGRLYYTMGKNDKAHSLKIPKTAIQIFDKYSQFKESPDSHIFQELKKVEFSNDKFDIKRKIKTATKQINNALKELAKLAKIDKKLTSHIARHSFGGLSGGKIPLHVLQYLFRHSHISTTMNYMKSFDVEEADKALENVISF